MNVLLGILLCLIVILIYTPTFLYRDLLEGFNFPGSHTDYVNSSDKKYSPLAQLVNPVSNSVSVDKQTKIERALSGYNINSTDKAYTLNLVSPTMTRVIPNIEAAKKCQGAPTTCSAFDDPEFAKNCGMSMDANGTGVDGKPFTGGLFVSEDDRAIQMKKAEWSKTPYQIYEPTLGTAAQGTFALTKDQCKVVKEKIDCETKQNFQVSNCGMCYTSQSFTRVDPDASKINFTLRLLSESDLEVTSTNPNINMSGSRDITISIPSDAEGSTFVIKNKSVSSSVSSSVSVRGYISGNTASNPFVLDVFYLVQNDLVSNQKPAQQGKAMIDGKSCVKMVPGKKKTDFAFSCLIPFSFLSTEGGLGCDTGPVITKEASAAFLESDPCFGKANQKGKYTTECLQSRWISVGGLQNGEGYPTDQNRSQYLNINGNAQDLDSITEQFRQKAIEATTGTRNGSSLSIPNWDSVSREMRGIPINTPCDGLDEEGPITKDCLSYLYLNKGSTNHIGPTYTLPSSYVNRKGQPIQNTYCQPNAPLDPMTNTGMKLAETMSIGNVKRMYDNIHRLANNDSADLNQRKDAIDYCYGIKMNEAPSDGVPPIQTIYGNNGSVNCDTYCGGLNGGPWNGELPQSWNGAKAVGGLFDGTKCKCQATGRGWDTKQRIYGNNGTVSCDTYCKGTNGGPWNGELPRSWNGAEAVGGFIAGTTDCICKPTGTGWK